MRLFGHLLCLVLIPQTSTDEFEYRLYETLKARWYSRWERPVRKFNDTIHVKIQLILQQIVEVDEKNQIIELNAWLKYQWNDYKLAWNPAEFGNITNVRLSVGDAWNPDVLVSNSADKDFDSTYPSLQNLYYNGDMLWIPPGILKCTCKINIRWFPFDKQTCSVKFTSWSYDSKKLELEPEDPNGPDTSDYLKNDEWMLVSSDVEKTYRAYESFADRFTDVSFYLHIKRRPLYYLMNLIIPSLMITFMTVLGFYLHPESGQKMTIEITTLVSVCFFLSVVASMTPATSEAIPIVSIYFTLCLVLVCASVSCSVYVLNIHYRAALGVAMSPTTRIVFLKWLPKILCMRVPRRKRDFAHEKETQLRHKLSQYSSTSPQVAPNSTLQPLAELLENITDEVKVVTARMQKEERLQQDISDWRFLATVLDQLFLIFFTLFFIGSSVGALLSSQFA